MTETGGTTGGRPLTRLALTFEVFHESHARAWYKFAHLQLGSKTAALRAVEAAFRELHRAWPHALRQDRVEAYAWAVLKDHVERRTSRGGSAFVETATFAELDPYRALLRESQELFGEMESRIGLFAAIARLPEKQHDVIVLRYVLGYSDARTGHILGVAETTVRSHVRWAKRTLARELRLEDPEIEGE
ncbi:RNA polymerase sigma factor [Embleya sp. NPDC050493]|uniref:RNA polymerase sigma factor n=1 Tax=Embleya sp. NPDC050493 TaxID=3363989 RepID=UPI00379745BF